jgi:hypothetical protein
MSYEQRDNEDNESYRQRLERERQSNQTALDTATQKVAFYDMRDRYLAKKLRLAILPMILSIAVFLAIPTLIGYVTVGKLGAIVGVFLGITYLIANMRGYTRGLNDGYKDSKLAQVREAEWAD